MNFTETLCGPHEKRLLNDLLDPYNTLERPVANESEPLQLSFGLMLMQIIDVVSTSLKTAMLYFQFGLILMVDIHPKNTLKK